MRNPVFLTALASLRPKQRYKQAGNVSENDIQSKSISWLSSINRGIVAVIAMPPPVNNFSLKMFIDGHFTASTYSIIYFLFLPPAFTEPN